MIGLLLDRDEFGEARRHFGTLNSSARQQSAYASVAARLQAVEAAVGLPPIDQLARRLHLNPNDLEARLGLVTEYRSRLSGLLY